MCIIGVAVFPSSKKTSAKCSDSNKNAQWDNQTPGNNSNGKIPFPKFVKSLQTHFSGTTRVRQESEIHEAGPLPQACLQESLRTKTRRIFVVRARNNQPMECRGENGITWSLFPVDLRRLHSSCTYCSARSGHVMFLSDLCYSRSVAEGPGHNP